MYQIQTRAFTPEGTIKAAEANLRKLMGIPDPLPVGRAYKDELKSNK